MTDDLHLVDSGRSEAAPSDAGDVFSARELAYISARSEGKQIKQAAKFAKPPYPYSTARRLDDREDVRAEIRKRARQAVEGGTLTLGAASTVAARTLKNVASGKAEASGPRVTAAKAILEISIRALEVEELNDRVARLEAQLSNQPGAPGFTPRRS
jgi:cytosine/adenosine deaminase-related metal-dependent hydrolase